MADDEFRYSSGFGNEFVTEAVDGALPAGRNSPQQAPLGLYAEQLSGTAFTQPRAVNRRTWVYRILPSAKHPRSAGSTTRTCRGTPFDELEPDPNRLRWDPLPLPAEDDAADFIDGLFTVGGNGDSKTRDGMAMHLYAANRSMSDRYFVDSDGELLFVPELGARRPAHRARPAARQPGRDRRGPARHQVPRRAARRGTATAPAATCARTSAPPSPCRNAARSAPTAWPTSGTSSARTPPSRSATTPSRW